HDPYRGFAPSVEAKQLKEKGVAAEAFDSVPEVIPFLNGETKVDEKIIIFGSLYLIGDMKQQWK
ncbi:MAG: hypothetical protein ABS873_00220, partial [Alkalibacterium sp.]